MLEFDICLEMVLTDLPYDERIRKIAECGFNAVEFWFHDSTAGSAEGGADKPKDAAVLRDVCAQVGSRVNNLVVNSPDGGVGGSPVDAGDLNKYLERLEECIAFAKAIDCIKGITCSGNCSGALSRQQMRDNLEKALAEGAAIAQKNDFTLLLEPLNVHVDHAGYFLDSSAEAADIIRAINSPNLRLLYDIYHMQIMEGNVISTIEKNLDVIGHFHSAGVPGRHELMTGELAYLEIIRRIEAAGYSGSFGLEYSPSTSDSTTSLTETRGYLNRLG